MSAAGLCALLGALHAAPPESFAVPAGLLGFALGRPGRGPVAPSILLGVAGGGLALLGPPVVLLCLDFSAWTGSAAAAGLPWLLLGMLLARGWGPGREEAIPSAIGAVVAAVALGRVLPAVGLPVLAVASLGLGLTGLAWSHGRSRRPGSVHRVAGLEPTPAGGSSPEPGASAGASLGFATGVLLLGTGPMVLQGAAPIYGGSLGFFAEVLAGVGLARLLAQRLPRHTAVGEVSAVAAGAILAQAALLHGPRFGAEIGWSVASFQSMPLLPSCIAVAAGVGLGLGARLGPALPVGAALGLVLWTSAGPTLGPDAGARLGIALASLGLLPVLFAPGALRTRAIAAAVALGCACTTALPAPPFGVRGEGLHRSFADRGQLLAALARQGEGRLVGGPSGVVAQGAASRWHRGVVTRPQAVADGSGALFGVLAELLGAPRGARVVHGLGQAAVLDAVAATRPVRLLAFDGVGAARAGLQDSLAAELLALGGVERTRADPLTRGLRPGAVLVDLPAPWVVGAPWAWSPLRLKRVRSRLSEGGVAVFRVPLEQVSAEEFLTLLRDVTRAYAGVNVWLDPSGAGHAFITARQSADAVDAALLVERWQQRGIGDRLRSVALSEPKDVLERLLVDQVSIAALGPARRVGGTRAALLSGRRHRGGRKGAPLAEVAAIAPSPDELLDFSGLAEAASQELRAVLSVGAEARRLYLQLVAAWQRGESDRVLSLAAALAAQSSNPSRDLRSVLEPWLRRGDSWAARGQWQAALREYTVARGFGPDDPSVNLRIGDVSRKLGDHHEAERSYRAALKSEPGSLPAGFGLGNALAAQGRLVEAIEAFENAEKLHPGAAALLVDLGLLHLRLLDESNQEPGPRLARARALFQRASALEPGRPQPWAGLAEVLERSGDLPGALRAVERALATEASCHYQGQRGAYLFKLGRLPEARSALQDSLLQCPEQALTLNALGAVEAELRDFDAARSHWQRALELDPDFEAARENLRTITKE